MAATQQKTLPEDRVCIGAITGVRGLRGEVRIKSFTADPEDIGAYGPVSTEDGERSFEVHVTARAKGQIIARLDGIDDRDAAEALKGTQLYVPKSELPETGDGVYYHADLMGLSVESPDGNSLGVVKAVHNFGAGDVIEIAGDGEGGKDGLMVPFTKSAVPEVDLEGGRIVVDPPIVLDAPRDNNGETEDQTDKE